MSWRSERPPASRRSPLTEVQSIADAQSTFVGGGASGMDGGDDVPLVHLDAQAEPEGERIRDLDLARLAALLRAADGVAGVLRCQVDVVRLRRGTRGGFSTRRLPPPSSLEVTRLAHGTPMRSKARPRSSATYRRRSSRRARSLRLHLPPPPQPPRPPPPPPPAAGSGGGASSSTSSSSSGCRPNDAAGAAGTGAGSSAAVIEEGLVLNQGRFDVGRRRRVPPRAARHLAGGGGARFDHPLQLLRLVDDLAARRRLGVLVGEEQISDHCAVVGGQPHGAAADGR